LEGRVTNPLTPTFNVIIPHFIKYPLVTQKRADFELFTKIVEILKNKGHIESKGLQQIVNLKASLNLGLAPRGRGPSPLPNRERGRSIR